MLNVIRLYQAGGGHHAGGRVSPLPQTGASREHSQPFMNIPACLSAYARAVGLVMCWHDRCQVCEGLVSMQEPCRVAFRNKVRSIFERLIRKHGFGSVMRHWTEMGELSGDGAWNECDRWMSGRDSSLLMRIIIGDRALLSRNHEYWQIRHDHARDARRAQETAHTHPQT